VGNVGGVSDVAEEASEYGAVLEGGVGTLGEVGEHWVAGVAAGEVLGDCWLRRDWIGV